MANLCHYNIPIVVSGIADCRMLTSTSRLASCCEFMSYSFTIHLFVFYVNLAYV